MDALRYYYPLVCDTPSGVSVQTRLVGGAIHSSPLCCYVINTLRHIVNVNEGILVPTCILTLHRQDDGLAGFVLAVLVVDGLRVVTACIGRHGGQDDQRVVQGDSTTCTAHRH